MDLRVHLPELAPAAVAAHERLAALPEARRDELARLAQDRAAELGLMRGPQQIPLVLSPVALPREELSALGRAARLVVSALVKVCRELIELLRLPEVSEPRLEHDIAPFDPSQTVQCLRENGKRWMSPHGEEP